ncbi:MAG TPA: hypothetical protein VGQ33_07520, partial [Vicinamibacteria bacterium]|nr:hypothetical protein [Vicinamibacteria bacterium]
MSSTSRTRIVMWWMAGLLSMTGTVGFAQEKTPVQTPPEASPPAPAPTPSPSAAPKTPWTAGYKNGFVLQSETGDFVLKLTGYVQADGR